MVLSEIGSVSLVCLYRCLVSSQDCILHAILSFTPSPLLLLGKLINSPGTVESKDFFCYLGSKCILSMVTPKGMNLPNEGNLRQENKLV